ncbi:MAG: hypothetical protein ABI690_25790 [Chloroflexota bacterium]
MSIVPFAKSWIPSKRFRIGNYVCIVFTDCENLGTNRENIHVMWVWKRDSGSRPCFAVAASVDASLKRLIDLGEAISPSCMLRVFPCDGKTKHIDMSSSADWINLDKFTQQALFLCREYLSLTEPVQELQLAAGSKKRMSFFNNIPE